MALMNFNRELKFYDFHRTSEKSVRVGIFSKIDWLDFFSNLNSTARLRTVFFPIILSRWKTKNAILWNTIIISMIFTKAFEVGCNLFQKKLVYWKKFLNSSSGEIFINYKYEWNQFSPQMCHMKWKFTE